MKDNFVWEVIITTYGTLRSDIKMFAELAFDYVILDESQAIKNPTSKVTKAASLLKASNRLCLSGTPLQNNTFDIYAQMNFLNPGMLGSVEFFKHNFSMPIDKFDEQEQKEHLRKFVFPFILRRTKEQVAKDLPEKQEMVLYCEMGDVSGLFICNKQDLEKIEGKEVYFGEILGKHSEISGTISADDFVIKTEDQEFIQKFIEIMGLVIS